MYLIIIWLRRAHKESETRSVTDRPIKRRNDFRSAVLFVCGVELKLEAIKHSQVFNFVPNSHFTLKTLVGRNKRNMHHSNVVAAGSPHKQMLCLLFYFFF